MAQTYKANKKDAHGDTKRARRRKLSSKGLIMRVAPLGAVLLHVSAKSPREAFQACAERLAVVCRGQTSDSVPLQR